MVLRACYAESGTERAYDGRVAAIHGCIASIFGRIVSIGGDSAAVYQTTAGFPGLFSAPPGGIGGNVVPVCSYGIAAIRHATAP
eukprot:3756826-Rhodomonas_salina.3